MSGRPIFVPANILRNFDVTLRGESGERMKNKFIFVFVQPLLSPQKVYPLTQLAFPNAALTRHRLNVAALDFLAGPRAIPRRV